MITTGLVRVNRSELSALARQEIKKELTIFPLPTSSFNEAPDPIRLWHEDEQYLSVPRGYFWESIKRRFDPSFHFDFSAGTANLRQSSPISLRPGQPEAIEQAMQALLSSPFSGVIVEAQVGTGKTVITLEMARRLGLKILVVVHNTVLMDQWITEIKRFFPHWSVGKIQGPVMDVTNNDICVGMIQSLSMKDDYPASLYREFGTMIVDEVHKTGSQEFKNVLLRFATQYIIGASGTLQRADRAENVFRFGIGPVVTAQAAKNMRPTIYFVDTKFAINSIDLSNYSREKHGMLNSLCNASARNKLIVENAQKAVEKGRHVLVLSERVAHVESLYRDLKSKLKHIKVGMMVGASSKAEREFAQDAQVLCATVQLLSTGFNNPRLDTLIFATPVQSVVQPVGRVVRLHPDKREPMVLDLIEGNSRSSRILGRARMKKYLEKGWIVKNSHLLGDKQ